MAALVASLLSQLNLLLVYTMKVSTGSVAFAMQQPLWTHLWHVDTDAREVGDISFILLIRSIPQGVREVLIVFDSNALTKLCAIMLSLLCIQIGFVTISVVNVALV